MNENDNKVSEFQEKIAIASYEPLLPVEKKLIGWSLGVGIVLLAILSFFKN